MQDNRYVNSDIHRISIISRELQIYKINLRIRNIPRSKKRFISACKPSVPIAFFSGEATFVSNLHSFANIP